MNERKHFLMTMSRGNNDAFSRVIVSKYFNKLILFHIISAICLLVIRANATTNTSPSSVIIPEEFGPHECDSLDIRNECQNFKLLENCTVVKGYLMIVLLPVEKPNGSETCDYDNITFPLLREVTDYIIFFHVRGLRSIRHMFPNLTVIRGRRLFLNYALGITEMPDLERVEFRSLIAIQRGHVFIGSSPKLCQLDHISWDDLTLSKGQNHIFPVAPETCEQISMCNGCEAHTCWSNMACQRFQNDNVLHLDQPTRLCYEECLGGCYNQTNAGCVVCRGLTDHGVCVKECPENKFMHEHSQRCYTRNECVNKMRLLTHQRQCVFHCPNGYKRDLKTASCVPCNGLEGRCNRVCQPGRDEGLFVIYNLADADNLSGCEIINGTLMIVIRNKVNENDLEILSSIREIRGYLRIFRSPYLTSLKFFKNLQKISGIPLESNHYSLIIYDNRSLKKLWKPEKLELERGGMYIHSNNMLCNRDLTEFREKVGHDFAMDSIQTSDQETLCGPIKLLLEIQVLSHRELHLSWNKEQTSDEVEIIYRPVSKTEPFNEETELDTEVCQRINWHRELIFSDELNNNGTHYSYKIDGLEQNTKYACFIKTFGSNKKQTARSELIFITTKEDIPPPPAVDIIDKTSSSLTIDMQIPDSSLDYKIDYYLLEMFNKSENIRNLDMRDYCQEPAYLGDNFLKEPYSNSAYNKDYDDCCARLEDDAEDKRFMIKMREEFSCSLNRRDRCISTEHTPLHAERPIRSLRLLKNQSQYTLSNLENFRLYVLAARACNKVGCSSVGIVSGRTNYTLMGDFVKELDGCRMPNSTEYRVFFHEPKNPNGAVVSYVIHFRLLIPQADQYKSSIRCITRLQHEKANYLFVENINHNYNQVAVRTHSLAGEAITNWIDITTCDESFAASTKFSEGINGKKNNPRTTHGSRRGLNTFLIFFLLGGAGTILWICYKRRYWRRLSECRNLCASRSNLQRIRNLAQRSSEGTFSDDRQVLVDNFEVVRFQNRPDDDDNDTTISSLSD